ncbi:MAG: DNA helicase RecQ [Rhodospirillaceae bacterium]|nr:DNA helicase RecQ [Rhodospirillaceae bacterium]
MSELVAAQAALKSVFGFDAFRPGQSEIIGALLDGENVLAVMPTGSGKSLCYQLPALLRPGLTVVVSPLIALMRDQVRQLQQLGVEAAALNSSIEYDEAKRIRQSMRDGKLKLLYVAPERLVRPDTAEMLTNAGVGLLAIDEAHCVSQWGHDFRPEYLRLGEIREQIRASQTIALTATADGPTRADIVDKLFRLAPRTFVRSFDRPNLHLAMQPKDNARKQIAAFLESHRGQSGIVYCASRKKTEELATHLGLAGYRTLPYHAGMAQQDRDANQDTFMQEDGIVIVATVAFGMGIDKPDVRFVAHADLPANVEAYYQEIGRAGRDGLPADTMTLYGLDDMRLRRLQIEEGEASEARKRIERQRFNALVALCESPRCRRQTLLAYFGESSESCGRCDLCQSDFEVFDGTVEAQKAMSAILRTGERFGTEHLVNVLTGSATEAIRRYGHDTLKTFGVGKDRDANSWRSILRQIYAAGLISLDIVEHGRWTLTEHGRRVLRGEEKIELRTDVANRAVGKKAKRRAVESAAVQSGGADGSLLTALKALRTTLAKAQRQPAYVIFPDRTLIELASLKPTTKDQLVGIHGIGEAKLKRYGTAFLDVILRHRLANGVDGGAGSGSASGGTGD